eukprot:TRINITY_DN3085_c0_g1_i1.p1 TRINITY_DN3085_c0_g1~~TRINITY_DN3085_c0_g1_i1.p1  ORF type:complete len:280 (-),score=53.87 TRINITY_DN3085_c0_g1_i1:14-853(-)
MGATAATIAVGNEMRYFIITELTNKIANLQGITQPPILEALREIKSEAELEILDCVSRATKASIRAVEKYITPGITQSEVATLLTQAQSAAGLTNIWHVVLFGKNAAFPHGTDEDIPLTTEMLALIDTGGLLHGYSSDVSRTFSITDDQTALHQNLTFAWGVVKAAQTAALEAIKPGVTCEEVESVARKVITDAGYGPGYMYFTHRLGHGIGLQVHEEPYLVEGNTKVLQEGMTFSVEPGIYVEDEWGIRLEDIVQVTSDGYNVFGPLSPSLEDPFSGH